MAERLDGIALGSMGVGALLVYAGVKGISIPSAIQLLISGKSPAGASPANQIVQSAPPSVGAPASATGNNPSVGSSSNISDDAMRYQGASYVWGGVPAKGVGNWDCSSFVNWVCGHDLRLAIPGFAAGAYDGSVHGPIVASWLAWSGLTTVSSPQAGDIVCFGLDTHMGIMISATQMISAENPQRGTRVDNVSGFGSPVTFRRYK